MSEILLHYHKVHPATWVYLSSLLMIGLFFKFNRFWSVRNVDLILLILLSPGLLLVHFGQQTRQEALKALKKDGIEPPNLASVDTGPAGTEEEEPEAQSTPKSAEPSDDEATTPKSAEPSDDVATTPKSAEHS